MPAILATGGRVFSPASRDATAIAHDDGVVTWVGQDAPGPSLYPTAVHVDLDGQWVAPAFVQCAPTDPTDLTAPATGTVIRPLPPLADGLDAARVSERVAEGERILLPPGVTLSEAAAVLTAVADRVGNPLVARCAPTLVGPSGLSGDDPRSLADLARVGAVVLLDPLGTGVDGLDLIAFAAAGIVLATTLGDEVGRVRPWAAIRELVGAGSAEVPGPLSPRAAFTAATRGAARAAGVRDGLTGTLAPGAPAELARWRTGPLVTTAAADNVRRWSTDPRSGVPPMPDLTGDDPVCCGLTVDGVETRVSTP